MSRLIAFFQTIARSPRMRWGVGLVVCGFLFSWEAAFRPPAMAAAQASWPMLSVDLAKPPVLAATGSIPMPTHVPAAHSSSLVAMPAGHADAVMAFWFAGTRESAADVGIAASGFDRASQQWRAARFVVQRHELSRQLGFGVRRLGNPVAWLDVRGQLHLFVVATGLGGWAASRIVHLRQAHAENRHPEQATTSKEALSFEVVRVLPLAWLWNTSYLVRNAPMPLGDGGMLLPVHFELGIKYPVALRFDARGEFKGMVRMSRRTHVLQPTVLAQDASHWLALMRDQRPSGRITVVSTKDAGQSWQDQPDLTLINPNASVAGLALAPGQFWLVHNSSATSRNVLDLSQSRDEQPWALAHRLAQGSGLDEYSYPAMAWADDSLWVSYTDHRTHIAWQRFVWPKR